MKELFKLWHYIKHYKWQLFWIAFFGAIMSATTLAVSYFTESLFDDYLTQKDANRWGVPLLFIGTYFVRGIARYFHLFLMKYTAEQILVQIRKELQAKFIELKMSYHNQQTSGGSTLLSKTLNDVNIIIRGFYILGDVIREPLTAAALIGFLFYQNWVLASLAFFALPLIIGILRKLAKGLRHHSHKQMNILEQFTEILKESLDGLRIIQSFNLQDYMREKLRINSDQYLKSRKSILKREEISGPVSEFITSIALAIVLIYAQYSISAGQMTVGIFMSFIVGVGFLNPSLKKMQDAYIKLQQCAIATARILDVIRSDEVLQEPVKPKKFPKDFDRISFENISFSYNNDKVLKNINLEVKKGSMIALVGESGSGKSTLMNLLLRFFDPQEGRVTIDGTDIRDFKVHDLREHIGLVTQDVFLFNDSIEANIRLGDPKRNASVQEAAKLANAESFISKLPENYKSSVGERGSRLSGGEKQRVSIARAIYKDAPILVLDEATSALDSASEIEVQKGLDQLMKGRTVFVIAHRLSTIAKADRILVLKNGEIVEQGAHQELVSKGGEYQRFHSLQNS